MARPAKAVALERSVDMLWKFYSNSESDIVDAAIHALIGGAAARACKLNVLTSDRLQRFQSAEALQVRKALRRKVRRELEAYFRSMSI